MASKYFKSAHSERRHVLNGVEHSVELYLDNSGKFDDTKTNPEKYRYHINPSAVLNLSFANTFNDWITEGTLTFLFAPDDAVDESGEKIPSYQFRGDGFDVLRVHIHPKVTDGNDNSSSLPVTINDSPAWSLSYVFSLTDIEDITDVPNMQGASAQYTKCLRAKFRDLRSHLLDMTSIEYSTATSAQFQPNMFTGLPTEGALLTGEAVLDILNLVLASPDAIQYGGCDEFLTTDLDSKNWDKGSNRIFYTSPTEATAMDDVNYLLSHHVSATKLKNTDVHDISFLTTTAAKEKGDIEPLSLIPLSSLFEKAGKDRDKPGNLQLEHFYVTSNSNIENEAVTNANQELRAPRSIVPHPSVDVTTAKFSEILSYSFSDMSPLANTNLFCNTPVYSADIASRKFRVEFQQNTVKEAKRILSDNYIGYLYSAGDSSNSSGELFLPTLHKIKENRRLIPAYTLNSSNTNDGRLTRQKNGIHQLLYTGIFQNACLSFTTLGLTLRRPGTFIAIDKSPDGCEDTDYNNKVFGQWFVVKVQHSFEAGIYINIIHAIKIHRYSKKESTFLNTLE